jgi:hypothetical protein
VLHNHFCKVSLQNAIGIYIAIQVFIFSFFHKTDFNSTTDFFPREGWWRLQLDPSAVAHIGDLLYRTLPAFHTCDVTPAGFLPASLGTASLAPFLDPSDQSNFKHGNPSVPLPSSHSSLIFLLIL